jgi:hypothetical protein
MKRVIIMMVALLSLTVATAQTTDHLQFRNIPITGKLDAFAQKLRTAGFQQRFIDKDIAAFEGSFIGYSDCTIAVCGTPITNIVHSVIVCLPDTDSWSTIKVQYDNAKRQFSQKYGEPSFVKEVPYSRNGGDIEVYYIRDGRATYATRWELENGSIFIYINKSSKYGNVELVIAYIDEYGSEINDREKQDEI